MRRGERDRLRGDGGGRTGTVGRREGHEQRCRERDPAAEHGLSGQQSPVTSLKAGISAWIGPQQPRTDALRVHVARGRDTGDERDLHDQHPSVAPFPQRGHRPQLDDGVDEPKGNEDEERRQCDAPEPSEH